MRIFTYATLILLSATLFVSAQAVGQPPAQENVDSVLRGWEKAMVDLQSFACEVQRKTVDNVFGDDEFRGYAMFMKPQVKGDGSRARLQLAKVKNPDVFEKYIVTGPFLYEYVPATKVIRIHDMPQGSQGGMQQESFLSFLFGMSSDRPRRVMK